MFKQVWFVFLCILLPAAGARASDGYFTTSLANVFIDWECAGAFICDEISPTAVSFGYGQSWISDDVYWEVDGFYTVGDGEISTLSGTEYYSVSGAGAYAVWQTKGPVFFSLRGGVAATNVDGPVTQPATGTDVSLAAGVGVGFGNHTMLEFRRLNRDISFLAVSFSF